jgi:hypothetical protein
MLRSDGTGVLLNSNPAPTSTALFRQDLIRTEKNSVARIEINGSTADIGPETIVEFDGDELALEHGRLSVNTSRGLRVRVGCLTVTPVNDSAWTHYDVADLNGNMNVASLKSDVYINERSKNAQAAKQASSHSNREIVRETERKSREDKCAGAYLNPADSPAGQGAILNSPWAKLTGAGVIATVACWGLCRSDDPISPSRP